MKKTALLLGAGLIVLASCKVGNPEGEKATTTDSVEATAQAEGTELTVSPEASKIDWTGRKVTGTHYGDVTIKSGSLWVKDGKITGGNFVADLTTINTLDMEGEYKGKLDGHLKSEDFFDVENHPEATFEITNVSDAAEEGKITVSGNLTMRGVTKNITFDATVSEISETSVSASADFNIAREDWGVSYPGQADDLISKEFNLKINLVAGAYL
ncbi:MAG: YceI family protein [Cyclobacteriaceae bacterium]|nr:YceI family protein [Cyclobacteriaceae bacterium]